MTEHSIRGKMDTNTGIQAERPCVCRMLEELRGVLGAAENTLDGVRGLVFGGWEEPSMGTVPAPADGILEDLRQSIERARAVDRLAAEIREALGG